MKSLTDQQKQRAVELLDIIVRQDYSLEADRAMASAIEEAQKMLGHWIEPPIKKYKRKTLWERIGKNPPALDGMRRERR